MKQRYLKMIRDNIPGNYRFGPERGISSKSDALRLAESVSEAIGVEPQVKSRIDLQTNRRRYFVIHKILMVMAASIILISSAALAHGGGLDSNGGHYDNKTGKYHYHRNAKDVSPCKPKPDRPPKPKPVVHTVPAAIVKHPDLFEIHMKARCIDARPVLYRISRVDTSRSGVRTSPLVGGIA